MRAITKGQVSRPIEQGIIDVGEFVTVEGADLQFVAFPSTKSVVENTTAVDTITTNLSGATFTISGVDDSFFTIGSSSGVLAFASAPDFESPQDSGTNNAYNITVTATKGSDTINSNMTITVINEGDVPPSWGGHTQQWPVIENATANSFDGDGNLIQGEVIFTPQNYANIDSIPVVWSFGAGTQTGTSSLFAIDATTGVITVDGAIDYENTPIIDGPNSFLGYRAVVNLSWTMPDGSTGAIPHEVLIRVNNAFDIAPTWNLATAFAFRDEDLVVGGQIYTPISEISNPDNGPVTFSIVSQTPANVFEYVAPNIQLAAGQSLDHETNASHSVVIGMTYTLDGQSATTVNQTLTVQVNDLDDTSPVFTSPAGIQAIVENDTATAGNTICNITVTDADSTGVTFTIQDDGGAGNRIQLQSPQPGALGTTLQTGAGAFDWENTQQAPWQGNATIRGYEIVVRATDNGGNFTDLTIQLQVSNADDEVEQFPTPSIPFATVEENEAPGVNIGPQVTMISNGDLYTSANTFELLDVGGNATDAGGRVAITSPSANTFQLKTGEHFFDYDTTTSHIVTVRCTDGGGNVSYQTYVIAVSDVTELTGLGIGSTAAIFYSMENPILTPMLGASTYQTASDARGGSGGVKTTFSSTTSGIVAGEIVRNPNASSTGGTSKRIYASIEERFNEISVDTAPLPDGNVLITQSVSKGGETQTHNHTQYKGAGVTGGVALSANTLNQSVEWTDPADGVDFEYGAQGDSSWNLNGNGQNSPIGTALYYALAENQQSTSVNNLFEMTDGKLTVPRIKKKAGANVQMNTPYTFITMAYPIRSNSTESYANTTNIANFPKREVWNRVFVGTAANGGDGTPGPSNNIGTVCERGRQSASSVTSTFAMGIYGGLSQGLKVAATGTDPEGVTISTSSQRPTFSMRVGDTLNITLAVQTYGAYGTLAFKSERGGGTRNNLGPSDGWTPVSPSGGDNTQSFTPTTKGTYYYQCQDHHWLWGVIEVYDRDYDAIAMKTGTPVAVSKGENTMSDGTVGNVRAGASFPYSRNIYYIRNHYQESGNPADQRKISFFNTYADAVANTNIVTLVGVTGMGTTTQVFRLHPVISSRNDVTFSSQVFDYLPPDTPYRQITTNFTSNPSGGGTSYNGEYDVRSFSLPDGDGVKKYRLYARSKATITPPYSSDWSVGWLEVVDANDNVVKQFPPGALSNTTNTSWQTIPGLSSSSNPSWSVAKSAAETQRDFHNSTSHWSKLDYAPNTANGEWAVTTGGTTSSNTGAKAGVFGGNLARTAGQASLITTVPENGNSAATVASSPSGSDDYKRQLNSAAFLYRETSTPIVTNSYGYMRSQESFVLPNGSGSKLKVLAITATSSSDTGFDGEEELQFGLVEDIGLFYLFSGGTGNGIGYNNYGSSFIGQISDDYTYSSAGTDPAGIVVGSVTIGSGGIYTLRQLRYYNGGITFAIEGASSLPPSNLNWRLQLTKNFNNTGTSSQAYGGYVDFVNATTVGAFSGTNIRYYLWNYSNLSGTNPGIALRDCFTQNTTTTGGIQVELVDLDAN